MTITNAQNVLLFLAKTSTYLIPFHLPPLHGILEHGPLKIIIEDFLVSSVLVAGAADTVRYDGATERKVMTMQEHLNLNVSGIVAITSQYSAIYIMRKDETNN